LHGLLQISRNSTITLILVLLLNVLSHAQSKEVEDNKTDEGVSRYILKSLPKNLLIGTRETFSGWNLAILGVGATSAIALSQTDADRAVKEDLEGSLGKFSVIGDIAGNGITLAGIAVSTYLIGVLMKDLKITDTGKALIEAQIIAGVFTRLLKITTGRDRPNGSGGRFNSSFPSGHASGSFAFASTIDSLYGHKVGIPLYLLAGYIGYSRISDNKHFLSDVLFGAALGTSAGRGVARLHKKSHNSKLAVVPYYDGSNMALILTMSW